MTARTPAVETLRFAAARQRGQGQRRFGFQRGPSRQILVLASALFGSRFGVCFRFAAFDRSFRAVGFCFAVRFLAAVDDFFFESVARLRAVRAFGKPAGARTSGTVGSTMPSTAPRATGLPFRYANRRTPYGPAARSMSEKTTAWILPSMLLRRTTFRPYLFLPTMTRSHRST